MGVGLKVALGEKLHDDDDDDDITIKWNAL